MGGVGLGGLLPHPSCRHHGPKSDKPKAPPKTPRGPERAPRSSLRADGLRPGQEPGRRLFSSLVDSRSVTSPRQQPDRRGPPAHRSGGSGRPGPPCDRSAGSPSRVAGPDSARHTTDTRTPSPTGPTAVRRLGAERGALPWSGDVARRPDGRRPSRSGAGPPGGRRGRRPRRSPEPSLRHRYATGRRPRPGCRWPLCADQSWPPLRSPILPSRP